MILPRYVLTFNSNPLEAKQIVPLNLEEEVLYKFDPNASPDESKIANDHDKTCFPDVPTLKTLAASF